MFTNLKPLFWTLRKGILGAVPTSLRLHPINAPCFAAVGAASLFDPLLTADPLWAKALYVVLGIASMFYAAILLLATMTPPTEAALR